MLAMRRQARQWAEEENSPIITSVTERPFAAALIGAIFFATSPLSPAPFTVCNLLSVIVVGALIRLMKPSLDKRIIPWLYALGVLFALDTARHAFTASFLFDQMTVILEASAGIALLAWSLTRGSLKRPVLKAPGQSQFLRPGAQVVLPVLFIGLAVGLLGYLRVARLLVSGVLAGGVLALTLSAAVRIISALIAFCLRIRPLRFLRMVQRHRDLLERRAHRILAWIAAIVWSMRVLDYVGMFHPAVSLGEAALKGKLERGAISLSLGDVLAFFLTVWAAFLLSSFLRFFLEEDVYPRRKIPQGFAYAASRLTHYLVMAVGFVLGLGMLGMDLTQVTVLLGAVGVGIGFGLQSVVNNFVSGLILLFERPIHVGDMVEIGSLLGRVRRIGIRASVVRTQQGSEIIVPNSQLISEQVTNWTYSDRTRRIEMPIGVNYGADPQKVIAAIEAAASDNPGVLGHPRPRAIFVGFGDSSLDFELRAWTERFEDWREVKSALGIAVYHALLAAGFSIPFPQREVRLISDSAA